MQQMPLNSLVVFPRCLSPFFPLHHHAADVPQLPTWLFPFFSPHLHAADALVDGHGFESLDHAGIANLQSRIEGSSAQAAEQRSVTYRVFACV